MQKVLSRAPIARASIVSRPFRGVGPLVDPKEGALGEELPPFDPESVPLDSELAETGCSIADRLALLLPTACPFASLPSGVRFPGGEGDRFRYGGLRVDAPFCDCCGP